MPQRSDTIKDSSKRPVVTRPFWELTVLLTLSLSLSFCGARSSYGQVRISERSSESVADIQQLLDTGYRYEQDEQWGRALSHYEDALRSHPGLREIQQRLAIARIHFDLGRRYADSTYFEAVSSMSEREALDLYSELLFKIHTHYVHPPNWKELVQRGTQTLNIAITNSDFQKRHLPDARMEDISVFQRELRSHMNWRTLRRRQDACAAIAAAGHLADQRLGLHPAIAAMEYACGAAGALDDYSAYLTPAQLDDVYSQIEGNFIGLGIELKASEGNLLIVNVLTASPAYQGGIRTGDRIIEVDGQSTSNISTDKAADMLKGREGSFVDLVIVSTTGRTSHFRLSRQRVEVPSVDGSRILDPHAGVAYLQLTSFQKTTSHDIDAALLKLHRAGMRSLIIDVRDNPGGLLTAAVEVADKFVPAGTIVSTRGRSPREDFDYKAHDKGTWRLPLVVLIDGDSASASEIFAAAVRDHRRGTIVGQRSYGKGSVQGIFPLNLTRSGIRITTAKFYTPNGQAISQRGVSPDVVVHVSDHPEEDRSLQLKNDPVIEAGIQQARQLLANRVNLSPTRVLSGAR